MPYSTNFPKLAFDVIQALVPKLLTAETSLCRMEKYIAQVQTFALMRANPLATARTSGVFDSEGVVKGVRSLADWGDD